MDGGRSIMRWKMSPSLTRGGQDGDGGRVEGYGEPWFALVIGVEFGRRLVRALDCIDVTIWEAAAGSCCWFMSFSLES